MKTEKNIFIAFVLNFTFAIFEFVGGSISGSVAIVSDAIHDFGDAISIGLSYVLEKKSRSKPDQSHTYGYARYSVLGSVVTTSILICGSMFVIINAIQRAFEPTDINYNEMLIFAIIGVVVNLIAAKITITKDSLNQKAVNLHMIEDVAGWIAVFIGAIIMKISNLLGWGAADLVDPLLSVAIAIYIMIGACRHLKTSLDVFLEKTPQNLSIAAIKKIIQSIDGIIDAHHIHVWSLDGVSNCATMHVVVNANHAEVKKKIKEALADINIQHSTLELESKWECCDNRDCNPKINASCGCGHNH